jgi:hypothetical protein
MNKGYPIQSWLSGVIVKMPNGKYAYKNGNKVSKAYSNISELTQGEHSAEGTKKVSRTKRANKRTDTASATQPTQPSAEANPATVQSSPETEGES